MQNYKNDFIKFTVYMINGIAHAVSWFLILILIYDKLCNYQAVSTDGLLKMIVWIVGAVFIFNIMFTRFIIKKLTFMKRLTIFMVSICLYEGIGFCWLKDFVCKGTVFQWWLAFDGIVFIMYLICILIFRKYSKTKGEIYTQALQKYQQTRSMEKGK